MNRRHLQITAFGTIMGLIGSGCANMTPGENAAVFGTLSGVTAGVIGHAAGMSSGEAVATGLATGAIVAATTYIIAKHQATERQRRIAEARARAAYASMSAEKKTTLKKNKVRYIAVDTAKDDRSQGAKNVMIWDTQSQELVGNNVYDVKTPPQEGRTAKFDTYTAQYVGS